jgi:hypothetical protein
MAPLRDMPAKKQAGNDSLMNLMKQQLGAISPLQALLLFFLLSPNYTAASPRRFLSFQPWFIKRSETTDDETGF